MKIIPRNPNATPAATELIQDLEPISEDQDWPELVLFNEIKTPSIPSTLLPCWLGEFCQAVSESTQTPPELAAMFALSVLSTCLQGKAIISPTGGDYWEPINLWTVVALPPSSRKSEIVKQLTAPLKEWEKETERRLQPLIDEAEATRIIAQKRITELQSSAAKESDQERRKQVAKEISELKETLAQPQVKAPKLFTGDITAEELQNQLVKHDEKMAVLSDEGGIFEVMTGLYNDGKANLDVFLQAWSGSSVRVNRGQREVTLDKPALSFGLTVQPEVMSNLGQGSKRKLRGIGALARFLYAIPRSNIGYRNVRLNLNVDPGKRAVFEYNIKTLLELTPAGEQPFRLVLSKDALQTWYDFAQFIEDRQGPSREFEDIQDWTGKLPGQVLRIAALFHIAENWLGNKEVAKIHIEKAAAICTLLIDHAKAAFESMSLDYATEDAKFLTAWLKEKGETCVLKRHLQRLGRFSKGSSERLNKALCVMQERGIISAAEKLETRKPTTFFRVNPLLLEPQGDGDKGDKGDNDHL